MKTGLLFLCSTRLFTIGLNCLTAPVCPNMFIAIKTTAERCTHLVTSRTVSKVKDQEFVKVLPLKEHSIRTNAE